MNATDDESRLIGEAILRASKELPAGYWIQIVSGDGGIGLWLCDPNAAQINSERHVDLLSQRIDNAIKAALVHHLGANREKETK